MEKQFLDLLVLLEKNQNIFKDQNVLILGDIAGANILKLLAHAASAHVLFDNLNAYSEALALFGYELKLKANECCHDFEYKHLHLYFNSFENIAPKLNNITTLLLLLTKSKQNSAKLLYEANNCLQTNAFIYVAGANAKGGKSADSLLKSCSLSKPYKVDIARKCTLFACQYEQKFAQIKDYDSELELKLNEVNLKLAQDAAVFSYQKLDQGTQLLLESLADNKLDPKISILDLGCGCGVIALYLKALGYTNVSCSDISAKALNLTMHNAKLNNYELTLYASNMLDNVEKYDLIVSNPPFHDGIDTNITMTQNMFKNAKAHLNANGKLIIVANAFLDYLTVLKEHFDNVTILKQNTKFIVYQVSI